MKRLLTLLAVLGLLLSACGDDDSTTDDAAAEVDAEEPADEPTDEPTDESSDEGEEGGAGSASEDDYVRALSADLKEGESFPGTDEQIECLAGGFVDALGGAEELRDADISPEALATSGSPQELGLEIDADEVAGDLVDTFEACEYDLVELLIASFGGQAPEGFEECVREKVTAEELAEVFAKALADPEDPEAASEISERLQSCLPDDPDPSAPTTSAG